MTTAKDREQPQETPRPILCKLVLQFVSGNTSTNEMVLADAEYVRDRALETTQAISMIKRSDGSEVYVNFEHVEVLSIERTEQPPLPEVRPEAV